MFPPLEADAHNALRTLIHLFGGNWFRKKDAAAHGVPKPMVSYLVGSQRLETSYQGFRVIRDVTSRHNEPGIQ